MTGYHAKAAGSSSGSSYSTSPSPSSPSSRPNPKMLHARRRSLLSTHSGRARPLGVA